MFRNYLLVCFRTLDRSRVSSLVNIVGLALGMSAFILMMLYVGNEISYDDFHEKGHRIYRLQLDRYKNGEISTQWACGCSAVGWALYENFPEVEDFTRFQIRNGIFSYGDRSFREERVYLADTSFFRVFSFPVLSGNPDRILRNPNEMVLSESAAVKYFEGEDPVGKSILFDGDREVMVTGVFNYVPQNSHLKPDIVLSRETLVQIYGKRVNADWHWDGFFNYILLDPDKDYREFESGISAYVDSEFGEAMRRYGDAMVCNLQPLRSIHLDSDFMYEAEPNGNARSVYALVAIAVFLVIIAWINYINLSTARALERAREVGMRKVSWASRKQLLWQFLLDSVLINLLAILVAVLVVNMLAPSFNSLAAMSLNYSMDSNPGFWIRVFLIFLGGALVAGIYPAMILTSFRPVTAFQGISELKVGGYGLRRILVIFQFAVSIFLIAGTLSVYRQISYMKDSDLGVDVENVLVVKGPSIYDSTYSETLNTFKSELLRNPGIEMVTASTAVPGRQPGTNAGGIRRISQGVEEGKQYRIIGADAGFIDFYGLSIIEGRNFLVTSGRNGKTALFNEAAIRQMGFNDLASAINVPIYFWGRYLEYSRCDQELSPGGSLG